jgi:nitroimidazol reductase NimA-like FMN-containing flavoprotein (pyridoxamine 5'-phosphate oxidase superfamily)
MSDQQKSLTTMRRHDRAMDDTTVRSLLQQSAVGVLATDAEGQPFVNNNLFLYHKEKHAIYLHTAGVGRTRSNLEANDRVCFTVFEMGRLLPAKEALEFSNEYASVVVFGRAVVVMDPHEQRDALQQLLDKYFSDLEPGRDYRPITDDELARTGVYRIDISEWSGKQKRVQADFPGARLYQPTRALEPG